jgi:glutamate-1-semialdehyde 2,1-aminomutase
METSIAPPLTARQRSPEEGELISKAKELFPAGVLANLSTPDEYLFVPDYGRGGRIYDKSGNEWIDYRCGSGCLILGHNYPTVQEAVEQQLARGFQFTQILNEPAIRLAEKVTKAIPSAEQVRFACTGGEAAFFAMRLARAHTGRDKILKFEGAYHGHGDHIVNMLPKGFSQSRIGHPGTAGIPSSVAKDYVIAPFNDLKETTALIERYADDLAGIIIEPLLGFIPPRPNFLEGLREVTRKHGACLIFDEVVTGFWTTYGGAQEYYKVTPDITALGKAFGGGFPISAVCASREIMTRFDYLNEPLDTVAYHGGSLYGHPVSAAASLATLTELEKPGVYKRLYALGDMMREGLRDLLRKHNRIPAQVMGTGPTWHLCFTKDEVYDYRSNMREDANLKHKFMLGVWANRIHVMGRGYISYAHTEEDLNRTIQVCDRVLRSL